MSIDTKDPSPGKTWTSKWAALTIQPAVGTMRRKVLDVIRTYGPLSADQVTIRGFGHLKHPYTIRPRLTELVDIGWLEKIPGDFHMNRQGNPEQVFRLTKMAKWRDESDKPPVGSIK
jgi:hypothetical protein